MGRISTISHLDTTKNSIFIQLSWPLHLWKPPLVLMQIASESYGRFRHTNDFTAKEESRLSTSYLWNLLVFFGYTWDTDGISTYWSSLRIMFFSEFHSVTIFFHHRKVTGSVSSHVRVAQGSRGAPIDLEIIWKNHSSIYTVHKILPAIHEIARLAGDSLCFIMTLMTYRRNLSQTSDNMFEVSATALCGTIRLIVVSSIAGVYRAGGPTL